MNREQARNYLKSSGMSEEQINEIEQGFKGEPCEDAVNRKSVQETITDSLGRGQNIHQLWQKIEDLPPVTVQEKTGRWKKIKSGDKTFPESIVCSRCGCENSHISEWDFNNEPLSKVFKTSKYCPSCGAFLGGDD